MGLIVHLFSVSENVSEVMFRHHQRDDKPRPWYSDLRETKVTVVVFAVSLKGPVINGMLWLLCPEKNS